MAEGQIVNIQEMPPPYHVGQLSSSDVSQRSVDTLAQQAGYPQQAAAGCPAPGAYEHLPAQSISPLGHTTQNNGVVMVQPVPAIVVATAPATVTVTAKTAQRKAKDFLIFSVAVTLLCFLFGDISGVLLTLPALICSLVAQACNKSGNYTGAKLCGYMALGCSIVIIFWFIFELITFVIVDVVAAILSVRGHYQWYTYCSCHSGSYRYCSSYYYNTFC